MLKGKSLVVRLTLVGLAMEVLAGEGRVGHFASWDRSLPWFWSSCDMKELVDLGVIASFRVGVFLLHVITAYRQPCMGHPWSRGHFGSSCISWGVCGSLGPYRQSGTRWKILARGQRSIGEVITVLLPHLPLATQGVDLWVERHVISRTSDPCAGSQFGQRTVPGQEWWSANVRRPSFRVWNEGLF